MEPNQHAGDETSPVKLYASNHVYSGEIVTKGYRVTDMLNDRNTNLLEMRNVTVTQRLGSDMSSISVDELIIRKSLVDLVVPSVKHEAPMRRLYNYQVKDRYKANLLLPGLLVTGIMHLPARITAQLFFGDAYITQDYFGITEAAIRSSVPEVGMRNVDVVIFNRHRMEGLSMEPEVTQNFSLLNDDESTSSESQSESSGSSPLPPTVPENGSIPGEFGVSSDPFFPGSFSL